MAKKKRPPIVRHYFLLCTPVPHTLFGEVFEYDIVRTTEKQVRRHAGAKGRFCKLQNDLGKHLMEEVHKSGRAIPVGDSSYYAITMLAELLDAMGQVHTAVHHQFRFSCEVKVLSG